MTQPGVLDGSENMFAGNPPQRAMAAGPAGQPPGNHALQDYQMQLMLLEQQNKKRLLMARQEQDNMSAPHAQGVGGPAGFSAAMSPQGSRAGGPSPNPADQIKKNTPRMGAQGLPGSPMPEGMMQPQRNSPAPNMPYDPNAPPQGFQQQYPGLPGQMPTMMRPNPSSHPGQQFNGQQMTPQQQMEMMQRNGAMQNGGGWRGPPGQPGMMPNQQQMGPMGQPQQRGQMPPPPAPANEQPRPQVPSPSQPTQAPPTPSQSNKANPKKKNTKDNKVTWRAFYTHLSIVDIDFRSPQIKKGQQVQLPPHQTPKNRLRQLLPCIRTLDQTDSSSNSSNRLRPQTSHNHLQHSSSRNNSLLLTTIQALSSQVTCLMK